MFSSRGKKIENKLAERVPLLMDVSVFLSSHWVGRWVGGWAPPVLLVLSFNTNEEELVMRAFGEEHSVKTAAHVSMGIG